MPIYDYRCRACERRFSHFARTMSSSAEAQQEAPVPCPECGSADTVRVMAPFAVQGPPGADAAEAAAARAEGQRTASITPREQINTWRSLAKG